MKRKSVDDKTNYGSVSATDRAKEFFRLENFRIRYDKNFKGREDLFREGRRYKRTLQRL